MNNTKIAIVVSHQDRIRQFLEKNFENKQINKPGKIWGEKKTKFRLMNGAVLKITYTPGNNNLLTIDLIYSGELNGSKPKKDPYLISEKDSTNNENIQKYTKNPHVFGAVYKTSNKFTVDENKDTDNNTYIIYLVRHGDGIHNRDKGAIKITGNIFTTYYRDAELTDIGKDQAFKSGDAIYNDIINIIKTPTQINYIFASDLYRSRQTLDFICDAIKNKEVSLPKVAIVVPCINEILKSFMSEENKISSTISNNEQQVFFDEKQKIIDNIKELQKSIQDIENTIENKINRKNNASLNGVPINLDIDMVMAKKEQLVGEKKLLEKELNLLENQQITTVPNDDNDYDDNDYDDNDDDNDDNRVVSSNRIDDDDNDVIVNSNRIDENDDQYKNFYCDWSYYNAFFEAVPLPFYRKNFLNKNRNVYTETICETYNLLDFILRIMMGSKKLMPTKNGGKTTKKYNKRHRKYKTIKKKNNKKVTKRKSRRNKKNTRRN